MGGNEILLPLRHCPSLCRDPKYPAYKSQYIVLWLYVLSSMEYDQFVVALRPQKSPS